MGLAGDSAGKGMNRRRNVNVQDKRQTPQGTPTLDSLARDLTKLAKRKQAGPSCWSFERSETAYPDS